MGEINIVEKSSVILVESSLFTDANELNIIEEPVNPIFPKSVPNQFYTIYVPVASTNVPGVVTINDTHFTVDANGRLHLNEKWFNENSGEGVTWLDDAVLLEWILSENVVTPLTNESGSILTDGVGNIIIV